MAGPVPEKECPVCTNTFPPELLQPVHGRRPSVPMCPLCGVQIFLAIAGIIPPDPAQLRGKNSRLLYDMAELHLKNKGKSKTILLLPDRTAALKMLLEFTR